MSSPILLIGIGNEYRCDDHIGLHVIRILKERKLPETIILESSGDGAELIEMFSSARMAILIDAVASGGNPGTIYQFDAHKQPIPAQLSFQSTHAFGVGEAIELARVFEQLPPILLVYAIEGENFSLGIELTPKVEQAGQRVVEQVCEKVQYALKQLHANSD
jgi:hydrogenase maturation protease